MWGAPRVWRMPPTRGVIGAAGFGRGAVYPFGTPAGNSPTKRPSRRRTGFDMGAGQGGRSGPARDAPERRSGRPEILMTPGS